jgi:4-hydroxy-tetrahydrodipicolinate reductase
MRIAIAGAGGRMGQALIDAVLADRGLTLAAAFDVPGSPLLGRQFGTVKVHADAAAAIGAGDVLIDFTRPEGTLAHLDICARLGRAMVIGTTGFSASQRNIVVEAGKRIPVAMAANYAVGVNAVYKLAESAARILGDDYDVEIIEAHHRHKVDAPSGTALELGRVVARALGRDPAASAVHGRHGDVGARPPKAIGFHAVRGGDIVGEHTVLFAGAGERVEVTVRSQSRATYAAGALRAAKWLNGRPPGLYDMADVLGLRSWSEVAGRV